MKDQLLEAIKNGDTQTVSALLDADPELLRARTDSGVSAILWAMYNQKPAIAQLFIERGLELDFFEAAASGKLDRVRELAAADPSLVNAYSPDGYPPLGLAAFFGQPEVVEFLVEQGAGVNAESQNQMRVRPIHAAVARRDLNIVRMLLEHGADVNVRQQMGFTPLHSAALHGDRGMIELLLQHGADATAQADNGMTAAAFAIQNNQYDAAAMLRA
jgi:ankyrin repeat protein